MKKILLVLILVLLTSVSFAQNDPQSPEQYLAFQIFTETSKSDQLRKSFPPMDNLKRTVKNIVRAVGSVGQGNRHLGFIIGPLSFDHTDEEVRGLIHEAFQIAHAENIAVGFHIDDSMFWGRLKSLNTKANIEWLDWEGTPNTGRSLEWSSNPIKIMPQLCINSPAVKEAVKERAELIGKEIRTELEALRAEHKEYLFMGIIAGWETQIGKDHGSNKLLGYCALTNRGYGANNPPPDQDKELENIVSEFIESWAKSLTDVGIPSEKIFSHTAFVSRTAFTQFKIVAPDKVKNSYSKMTNHTPVDVSFGQYHRPGFTTYPQIGQLEEIKVARSAHNSLPWASCEGTAIDPAQAEQGGPGNDMEMYLGNLFNHDAVLVNIFGWGVGDPKNPYRKTVENKYAIAAYQKFLRNETLMESPISVQPPSDTFLAKILKLQQDLPPYIKKYGPSKVNKLYEKLNHSLSFGKFQDAERIVDQLFQKIQSSNKT